MSVLRPGIFLGKVALVTGGGTGIGKAITKELLTLGCKVAIASRNIEKLQDAANELGSLGEVHAVKCNIREEAEVKSAITDVLQRFGHLDFLVNNGGGQFMSRAQDIKLKGWKAVIETNLTGTFLVSQEAFNQHFEKNGGVIINIIADMFRGFPLMSHTGAARAAVENLTRSLSIEWASNGVRVNAVAPGIIYSKTASQNYALDVFQLARPEIPAKRLGSPQEVSSAVCFLLSPGASFITGATLRVDCEHNNLPEYKWSPENEAPKSKL